LLVLAAIAATASGGCTRTYNVARPKSAAELQLTLMANDAGVVTPIVAPQPSAPSAASSPVPWGTSLTPSGEVPTIDMSQVGGYEVRRRGAGALEGLLIGTLGGAFVGFAIGASLGSDSCANMDHCYVAFSSTEKGAIGAVLAGATGLVLDTLIGAVRGHKDRYLFQF
jgi:hypothetical protein